MKTIDFKSKIEDDDYFLNGKFQCGVCAKWFRCIKMKAIEPIANTYKGVCENCYQKK